MRRLRWSILAALGLAAFALVLAVAGGAAWCDDERFGYFLQTQPAPYEVPSIDFTLEDAALHPDVQRALDAVGSTVRADDPASAQAFVARMEAENAVAVRVQDGNYFLNAYEQTPSDAWRNVCGG